MALSSCAFDSAIIFRPAYQDETARADYLCPTTPGDSILPLVRYVALKREPVERIIGVIWGRFIPSRQVIEFECAFSQGFPLDSISGFYREALDYFAQEFPSATKLRLAGWHAQTEEWCQRASVFGLKASDEQLVALARFSSMVAELESNNAASSADFRSLKSGDLSSLANLVGPEGSLEPHEILALQGGSARRKVTPFHLDLSFGAFEEDQLKAACLGSYVGSDALLFPLLNSDAKGFALLKHTLVRIEQVAGIETVRFFAPERPLVEALPSLSWGSSRWRFSRSFPVEHV